MKVTGDELLYTLCGQTISCQQQEEKNSKAFSLRHNELEYVIKPVMTWSVAFVTLICCCIKYFLIAGCLAGSKSVVKPLLFLNSLISPLESKYIFFFNLVNLK